MNCDAVEKIANAVFYEGYMLYPYRASAVKNQQRFNFGVLYPREYCDFHDGSHNWEMPTECFLIGNPRTPVKVKLRFLQFPINRQAIERAVSIRAAGLPFLHAQPVRHAFHFDGIGGE